MKYEVYSQLAINDDFSVVDFFSCGRHGVIPKRIVFTPTEIAEIYNLAFGDVDEDGEINDYSISDNGDRDKVLATVVNVVGFYTKRYSRRWVLFRGSTKERTRLYRMAVGLNLKELQQQFEIYAYIGDQLTLFRKNMELDAFLIRRKNA